MKVILLEHTLNAMETAYYAARTCYSHLPSSEEDCPSEEKMAEVVNKVVKSGHHSVLEHISYTFSIEGVSRSMTHQLVRHRLASYSQQSQRYVKMDKPTYVIPPSINSSVMDKHRDESMDRFVFAMEQAWDIYNELVKSGVPPEDARYVLPNACTTNIVVTMNARELFHFFELRMCNRAQWEIREVANEMHKICMEHCPEIFVYAGAPCETTGKCHEVMTCGKPLKKRKI